LNFNFLQKMKNLLLFLIFSLFSFHLFAQNAASDSQLASQYFSNKEYDKAAVVYERLYNTTHSKVYFSYYLKCLIELKEYDEAEKRISRQLRQNPEELSYYVELGSVYEAQNENDKAEEEYQNALEAITNNQTQTILLANAFLMKQKYNYAIKTYLAAREKNTDYTYHLELASVYSIERDYDLMFEEYLNYLDIQNLEIGTVQNRIQFYVTGEGQDEVRDILKEKLLKRIQQGGRTNVYSEMLVWLYIQEKDFEKALFQAKALDKRLRQNGMEIINLAQLAISNGDYNVARDAYTYVAEKGNQSPYYFDARYGILNSVYQQLESGMQISSEELISLENQYLATVEELGSNSRSIFLMKDLAHLQAFYLNKQTQAMELLEEAIIAPNAEREVVYECKLELADIKLFTGDIWAASMLYYEVEKNNTEAPIGHEAKFKNAKLAFYTGNFDLAQAQLDVLKSSTSKLIANDAFELYLIITDNSAMDSTGTALRIFSRADMLLLQNKHQAALLTLDSIVDMFPSHSIIDEVYYKKATVYFKQHDYERAAEYYKKVLETYSWDIYADDALFKLGELYQFQLNDKEVAMNFYKQMLTDYPGSIYVIEARKRYRQLRGDNI